MASGKMEPSMAPMPIYETCWEWNERRLSEGSALLVSLMRANQIKREHINNGELRTKIPNEDA